MRMTGPVLTATPHSSNPHKQEPGFEACGDFHPSKMGVGSEPTRDFTDSHLANWAYRV